MSKSRKPLAVPRKRAYANQAGRCFYCNMLMWQDNPKIFASQYKLSLKQAMLLQCTGEHLTAHCNDGEASASNIVAACWYCNNRRHKRSTALTPSRYRAYVHRRITKGCWHQLI